MRNSEVIKIVTRDRFSPEQVLDAVTLSRFQDYTIDYDRGTLIFKQPIFSQDGQFNPVFIEAEYEVAGIGASDELVAGARVAYRLDQEESEFAVTYISDDTVGQGGELAGADFTWQFTDQQKITLEYAQTDTDIGGRGDAYLAELEHRGEKLAGRVYVREQDLAFGLGHQSTFERGVRKIGAEGDYRLGDNLLVNAQAFQQKLLEEGSERFVVNLQAEYTQWDTQFTSGLRSVQEETQESERDATQLVLGAARGFFDKKLTLRSEAELDVSNGDNTDYPSRAILGAEYKVLSDVSLIAEQELSWGDSRDTQDTRFGVRARPWSGTDVHSIVQRSQGEAAERLFATTGLLQQWRLNQAWLIDVGFDRVQTLSQSDASEDPADLIFNPFNPPASGSFNNDFTAMFVGFGYQQDSWNISSRLEFHQGDQADKWNLLFGANRQLAEGRVVSSSFNVLTEELALGGVNDLADLRVGFAWRPSESAWSILARSDLIFEKRTNDTFDTRTRKWVTNTHVNYKPRSKHQFGGMFAMKYVIDQIDGVEYDGVTLLYGGEYRYDLNPRWDLGVHGVMKSSLEAGVHEASYGLSVGFNAFTNTWISVGYNHEGFEDDDFVGADYTAKGPYLKLRLKVDQELAKRFLEHANFGRRDVRGHANGN